jgi:glycosyltransferase involved in cell wall biosynthesis
VTEQATTQAAVRRGAGPGPIMLVVDALYRNGATVINLELAKHWAGSGGRLVVVQRLAGDTGMTPPPEVRVVHLQDASGRLRTGLPGVLRAMVRQARESAVVVAGSEIGVALSLSYLAARIARRPFVVGVHADVDAALEEWIPRRQHGLHHWIYRHADGAVAVSAGLVDPLVRHGADPTRVRVVRNGIDLEAARRRTEQQPVPADVDDRCVVVSGRLAHQKGIDVLLRAHAEVVGREPHRVLLINDGPEEAELRRLAEELGVSDTVEFRGAVPNPLAYVARAGLFCLPSRHEGLPLALIEAVALGAPCIAADCAEGIRVALDEGRVGDLVPVDDVDALADALGRHLADPAALRAKAARGPEHAAGFDSAVMAQEWAAALAGLVS